MISNVNSGRARKISGGYGIKPHYKHLFSKNFRASKPYLVSPLNSNIFFSRVKALQFGGFYFMF